MEKKDFPGLIKPLVNRVSKYIFSENRPLIIGNFGSGGMETERQIIKKCLETNYQHPIIFVGIDQSEKVKEIAKDNLKELEDKIEIIELEKISRDFLKNLKNQKDSSYIIILCKNNIFHLDKELEEKTFDLVFHTLFRHHIVLKDQNYLDQLSEKISGKIIEYDGIQSWGEIIPQTIVGWNNPVFLNAEIFSNLRFLTKKEVQKRQSKNNKITFHPSGYYMLEYIQ